VTDSDESRRAIERYLEAIKGVHQDSIDRALDTMTDDVVWINPRALPKGQSGCHEGKPAVRTLLEGAIPEVYEPDSLRVENSETIVDGDRGVTVYDTVARTTTGATYEQHFVFEFRVRDGKLSLIRENFDTLHYMNIVYGGPEGAVS
jgi:ketosteroid isomerase-like protein